MQINHNSSPNFGMAMHIRPEAQKILAKTLTDEKSIERLEKLVENQRNNPFNIDIRDESSYLTAYISDKTDVNNSGLCVLKQCFIEKFFKSPIDFITRCCQKADSLNEEKYQTKLNPKLKEIFNNTKPE